MSEVYMVRIQIRRGALVVSENDYEYESMSEAEGAAFQACDVAEQADGIKMINGGEVS